MEPFIFPSQLEAQSAMAQCMINMLVREQEKEKKKELEQKAASDYYTLEEAANYLRCDAKTVKSLVNRGKLKYYRVEGCRRMLFLKDDVHKLPELVP